MTSDVVRSGLWASIAFFALLTSFQLLLTISAGAELRDLRRRRVSGGTRRLLRSSFAPRVSLLVPAYNEETMIAETVESMLAIEYPNLEVVVVNDGATDRTIEVLIERFELETVPALDASQISTQPVREVFRSRTHPGLVVVDKENGGKADALNAGLVHARGVLVCAIDADTFIEHDAIERLVVPFQRQPALLAAGGSVRPVNGCRLRYGRVVERRSPLDFLAGVQTIEYSRAFLFGRLGWNRLGGNVIISGAFGLFDRTAVMTAGGYLDSTVGEDMELVLRLRRQALEDKRPSEVSFLPDPMAWTEVPESLRTLARQRNRWHRGLMDVLWRHRDVIGRPRYGRMGTVVLPYYLLEMISPVVEVMALLMTFLGLAVGVVDTRLAAIYFVAAYGFGLVLSSVANGFEDRLDEEHVLPGDRRRRLRFMVLEQIGYRQMTVVWRLWGMVSWLRGDEHWGAQVRRGVESDTSHDRRSASSST